jgi:hypothetical protein
MDRLRFAHKLALLFAFFLCIALGFGLAVFLRDRLAGSAEADPCFGQGELVGTWEHDVTQEDIDRVVVSRPELSDLRPGMVEYRRCRWGAGFEVIVDDKGHVYSFTQPSPEQVESYYKDHPDENPANQLATAQAESEAEARPKDFVTPVLPSADVLEDTISAGCGADWITKEFPLTGLAVCFPPSWTATEHPPETNLDSGVISITFEPKASGEPSLDCAEPVSLATSKGEARLCSYRPDIGDAGQGHQLSLPNGHRARIFIADPTQENTLLALRVALAGGELP